MALDMDEMNSCSDEELKDLIRHEFGHNLGLFHTFADRVQLSEKPKMIAYLLSRMSYGDPDMGEAQESPALPFVGSYGPMDLLALRQAVGADAPKMNMGDDSYNPRFGYTDKQSENIFSGHTFESSDHVYTRTGFAMSIIDNGGRDRFILPGGDAINAIDFNPGMVSLLDQRRGNYLIALLEGQMEEIYISGGKNTVTAARAGSQDFIVGGGTTSLAIDAPLKNEIAGRKTIVNNGGKCDRTHSA